MRPATLVAPLVLLLTVSAAGQEHPDEEAIRAALKNISPHVIAESEQSAHRAMLGQVLRERIRQANQRSTREWSAIQTRDDWERFRRQKVAALRAALGPLPARPDPPRLMAAREIAGDGFTIRNLVYESRPGLVVTANLYVPQPPRGSMPGILLSHSHHNPKEQGELQDMGMTWARAGCYVLVPDHFGHGERRQHPFASPADYHKPFQVGRQDYYFRFDMSLQLYLAGQTLMGWMAHDLMTGVDVLLAQPGIDRERIILLGAVAGGGDPAAVTGALDERIACVVPFNFGGPQPETRYPLPEDAETSFNYAGGGSWESTRNLYRSAEGGFLPWVIVGAIAPRRVIHAHEFAWDRERDPVWKRYQKIWSFYDAGDDLAFAHGHGGLTTTDPPGSHCNNIGAVHRRQIHEAFRRWFGIDVRPENEYSRRLAREELTCLTEAARREFQPKMLHEILAEESDRLAVSIQAARAGASAEERRTLARENWTQLLGDSSPPERIEVRPGSPHVEDVGPITVRREVVQSEPGISVPILTLSRTRGDGPKRPWRMLVVGVASDGIGPALARRQDDIASGLSVEGLVIALVEVRGAGAPSPGQNHGPQGALTAHAATHLLLGEPLLAGQLRDLRTAWRHLRRQEEIEEEAIVVGGSGAAPLPADAPFAHPRRIDARPPECQPTGALLALLLGLYENTVTTIEARRGLVTYRSTLDSPFVQVPLASIAPGVLLKADLPDLVAALAPRRVSLEGVVDGRGRAVAVSTAQAAYDVARRAYIEAEADMQFIINEASRQE